MDQYHVWCDLKDGSKDLEFVARVDGWLGHLVAGGKIASYRLSRRKLGLGPKELGEFHILIETRDMAQLDSAFAVAAARDGQAQKLHAGVYSMVTNLQFGLWRDFPDPMRAGSTTASPTL